MNDNQNRAMTGLVMLSEAINDDFSIDQLVEVFEATIEHDRNMAEKCLFISIALAQLKGRIKEAICQA